MFASLLLLDFVITKYDKSEKIIDIFDELIKDLAETIEAHDGKLGVKAEWTKVEEVGKSI